MNFISLKKWLNENKIDKVTVLFPGGFKPMTAGHISLIKRYLNHPNVKEVKVLIGPGIRNGIDQNTSLKIAEELLASFDNVSIETVKYPSPILAVYKYIETALPGTYAMGSVDKDEGSRGYQRVLDFVKGYNEGGKYYHLKPKDVTVTELQIDINPILYTGRTDNLNDSPVSASVLRKDILNNDYNNFKTNYSGYDETIIKPIWNNLKGIVTESYQLFEGGNAISDSRRLSKDELLKTYEYVKIEVKKILNISDGDLYPVGSFAKKLKSETYGDIDILLNLDALDVEKENALDYVYEKFKYFGYDVIKTKGFNQVSVGFPVEGDDSKGVAQVDFMLSENMEWSKFSYYSTESSKYRAAYATFLFTAIITESFKEVKRVDENGQVKEYSFISYRLPSGLFKVTKSHEGKKGRIKIAKIVKEEFLSNDPKDAIEIAVGENHNIEDVRNFEKLWKIVTSKNFIHKDKLEVILDKFKFYLLSNNLSFPEETKRNYPEIFKINESLNENGTSVRKLNTHMQHIEELLFEGKDGLSFIKYVITNLYNKLTNNPSDITLSIKIDGAPTMMLWSKFTGLKDYGVGTKTVFNKDPITCHTSEDIEKYFGDRPSLASKLKILLKYAKDINIPENEIWQGDFLFDKSILRKERNEITFKPNTIKYSIDVDSELGKRINDSEFGIIWHTRYLGEDISSVKTVFSINLNNINHPSNIYMSEPYLNTIDADKLEEFIENNESLELKIDNIKNKLDKLNNEKYVQFLEYKTFQALFQKFYNKLIKSKNALSFELFKKDFIDFVRLEKSEKIAKKLEEFIKQYEDVISNIIDLTLELKDIKNYFLTRLNKLQLYRASVELKSGITKNINQEGFAVSSPSGDVVKIVDREEFSYLNFSPDIIKGWEK